MDIFTTMITPYKADRTIDLETAEKYVDWYFENGLTGIFAICQSSEIFCLTLEEKVALNKCVYERAKKLEKESGRPFTVVSSGHTSDTIEEQARELNAVWESGTDALIFISNRLDPDNKGDDVFIENAEKLISLLPKEAPLGIYECPYPYKRLITPKLLDWMVSTGRFRYTKDTCCDFALLDERNARLRGTGFSNLNANCQSLLSSLKGGGEGYCGIMANFHPRLYSWLCKNYEKYPCEAELVQGVLGTFGFMEGGLPYPETAKYHMNLVGIPTNNIVRTQPGDRMTDYARRCVEQMKLVTDKFEELIRDLN